MSKQPTIRDVAEKAGVCASTASRALAGKGAEYRISDATIARVQEAAKALKYRGSAIARSLRTRRSGLLGIVVPDIANLVFATIAGAVTRSVEPEGYGVLIADSRDSTEREIKHLEQLASRQVEGIVVCPVGHSSDHIVTMAESGVPLIMVDRVFFETPISTIASDSAGGAEQAVAALVQAGHHRIGCLQGLPGTLVNDRRVTGFLQALERHGLQPDPTLVAGTDFTVEDGARACRDLLGRHPDITGLFVLSSQLAVGTLQTVRELHLSVPNDLSLVAFDDHPLVPYLSAPLTTCSQNEEQMGRLAAEVLLREIRAEEPGDPERHVVPVLFQPRASIAPPRAHPLNVGTPFGRG